MDVADYIMLKGGKMRKHTAPVWAFAGKIAADKTVIASSIPTNSP